MIGPDYPFLHHFFMSLHAPVLTVYDFFPIRRPYAHQCPCSCCSLWLERLNTQPPTIETYHIFSEMLFSGSVCKTIHFSPACP